MSRNAANSGAMRILMVVPHYPPPVLGGSEKQASLLARALAEEGHVVIIMSRRFHAGHKPVERDHGCEVIRLSFGTGILGIFNDFYQLLIPFQMFARRNEFDIVHVHTIRIAGIISLLTARMLGKKTLQKIPDVGVYGIFESCKMLSGAMRSWVFRLSADSIAAMSESSVQAIRSIGYSESRILRITNGVVIEPAVAGRAENGEKQVNIVFLGRLVPKKGILDLLAAWERVVAATANHSAELNIYGQGPMEFEIRTAIASRLLTESVKLRGYADDVQSVLGAADVLVLPSYEEGNSNAMLEAMAAGVPVISTNVGGASHLVGKAGRAFLHAPGDKQALSEMLIQLIRNERLRRETGALMRERCLEHFSIKDIKDRYTLAFRMLLDGKRERIRDCSQFPPD